MTLRTGAALVLAASAVVACQVIGGIDEHTLAPTADAGDLVEGGRSEVSTPDATPTCSEGICLRTVAAGNAFTCSREADARVRCWGDNQRGQLGDQSTKDRRDPAFVAGVTGATDIWAGADAVCARLFDGTVSCWGSNVDGELGDPELTAYYRARPGAVPGLGGVRELALGDGHACARTADAVLCWGSNAQRQVGQDVDMKYDSPQAVRGLGSDVVQVAAGGRTSCALRRDGSVWCWGNNDAGQLANGARASTAIPAKIAGLAPAVRIGVSANRICAALRDRTVWCWGGAADRDAGPPPAPASVPGVANAVDVALGAEHTCARTADSLLVCWGYDLDGQLGRNRMGGGLAMAVPNLTGVSAFDLGSNHTCARAAADVLYCWGSNANGELGEGSTTAQYVPTRVLSP